MSWITKMLGRDKKKTTKKTNKKMELNEAGIQRLISLKENFSGQKFQWIKTTDESLIGKVVECRNIEPTQSGQFMAHFSDGSKVNAEHINNKLMMLHGDMQPLSRADINAINGPAVAPRTEKIEVPPGVVVDPKEVGTNKPKAAAPLHEIPTEHDLHKAPVPSADIFAMFNAEETDLSINIKIKLPDRKLLKLMYTSAEDKNKFVDQLSGYVLSQINKDITKNSLLKILDPPKAVADKKSNAPESIKVTEL